MLDSLSWEVMNATADDWESLHQIMSRVCEFCGQVEPAAMAELIATLVDNGLMEEMQGRIVQSTDVLADPIDFWFRMTPMGRAV